jgi:hypothetical protein
MFDLSQHPPILHCFQDCWLTRLRSEYTFHQPLIPGVHLARVRGREWSNLAKKRRASLLLCTQTMTRPTNLLTLPTLALLGIPCCYGLGEFLRREVPARAYSVRLGGQEGLNGM